jgi:serine/threonine protein kinase
MPGLVLRDKYEVLEKLGAGGMGAVYKARHLAFNELRAIKFVGTHLLSDERALARFKAEAVVARRLQHPNAVKVEDLDTSEDGRPFIVMEYVRGRSLRDLFFDEGEVSTKRVLALARQACGALGAAHALGIVHRDIKPDNLMVLVEEDGTEILKVADFGLAKVREGFELAAEKAFTQTGFLVGTPPYMSPEQAGGYDLDGRSDLYSLGVVLYELFTGRLPFHADTPLGMLMAHRETPPQPPAALGVPQPLAAFLLKALAKRPEDRFQTAEQMDQAIAQLGLVSLPEFMGQGIREGFHPKWAGSRHASRVTTMRVTPTPAKTFAKTVVAPPPHRRGSTDRTLVSPGPPARSRPVPLVEEEAAPEPSSSKFWVWIGAAALLVVWLVVDREKPAPASAAVPAQAPMAVAAQSEEPSREVPSADVRTDIMIRFDIERLLADSTALRDARIRVEIANGVVTLIGEAPNQTAAELAVSLAASVPGTRKVFSALQGPAPVQADAASGPQAQPPAPPATPQAEPPRPPTPRPEDAIQEQVRALLDRARQKMEARNPDGARADLEAVLRLDPNNPVARDALERMRNRPPGGGPPGPRPTPQS